MLAILLDAAILEWFPTGKLSRSAYVNDGSSAENLTAYIRKRYRQIPSSHSNNNAAFGHNRQLEHDDLAQRDDLINSPCDGTCMEPAPDWLRNGSPEPC